MYTELDTDDRFPQIMCISSYAAEDSLQPPLRLTVSTPNVIAPGDAPEKTCIESSAVSVQHFCGSPQWASPNEGATIAQAWESTWHVKQVYSPAQGMQEHAKLLRCELQ